MRVVMQFALLALIVTGTAAAQQKKAAEPCADAQSQTEMNICWGREYKTADARLNETYRQFIARLSDAEKGQLRTAQTAWLKYRDTNCEFVADQFKGGSIRPMIAAICLAGVTDNRTIELKAQMKEREQY